MIVARGYGRNVNNFGGIVSWGYSRKFIAEIISFFWQPTKEITLKICRVFEVSCER